MRSHISIVRIIPAVFLWLTSPVFSAAVYAYIDPGTTGLVSQLLYVLFYGMLGIILYSMRSIKAAAQRLWRLMVTKLFRRR